MPEKVRFALAILRAAEVCALLDISAPTLYRWIKLGRFPRGFAYGPHCTGWTREVVEKWIGCGSDPEQARWIC